MKTKFKTILNFTVAITTVILTLSSCVDDLNTLPLDKNIQTTNNVLTNDSAYLQLLAKCYRGLAVVDKQPMMELLTYRVLEVAIHLISDNIGAPRN